MSTDVRRPVEAWARRWWRGRGGVGGAVLRVLTLPLEWLFRLGAGLRNQAYGLGLLPSVRLPVSVISVGNLAVGGTGKTPVAAWIVDALEALGHRPAVVSRGYGEDELRLHRRWHPAVPVHADPRRVAAARRAVEGGATAVVMDDGFQHRRLERDLDVVLLSVEHPLPLRLLPRGPYRESLGALRRADLVVLTRKTAGEEAVEAWEALVRDAAPEVPVARLRFQATGWLTLEGEAAEPPGGVAVAVAGLAGPETFVAMVGDRAAPPAHVMVFPDHHDYGAADAEEIARRAGGGTVVTTEKDAVKLVEHGHRLPDVRVLRLAPVFEEGEALVREAVARVASRHDGAAPRGQGPDREASSSREREP